MVISPSINIGLGSFDLVESISTSFNIYTDKDIASLSSFSHIFLSDENLVVQSLYPLETEMVFEVDDYNQDRQKLNDVLRQDFILENIRKELDKQYKCIVNVDNRKENINFSLVHWNIVIDVNDKYSTALLSLVFRSLNLLYKEKNIQFSAKVFVRLFSGELEGNSKNVIHPIILKELEVLHERHSPLFQLLMFLDDTNADGVSLPFNCAAQNYYFTILLQLIMSNDYKLFSNLSEDYLLSIGLSTLHLNRDYLFYHIQETTLELYARLEQIDNKYDTIYNTAYYNKYFQELLDLLNGSKVTRVFVDDLLDFIEKVSKETTILEMDAFLGRLLYMHDGVHSPPENLRHSDVISLYDVLLDRKIKSNRSSFSTCSIMDWKRSKDKLSQIELDRISGKPLSDDDEVDKLKNLADEYDKIYAANYNWTSEFDLWIIEWRETKGSDVSRNLNAQRAKVSLLERKSRRWLKRMVFRKELELLPEEREKLHDLTKKDEDYRHLNSLDDEMVLLHDLITKLQGYHKILGKYKEEIYKKQRNVSLKKKSLELDSFIRYDFIDYKELKNYLLDTIPNHVHTLEILTELFKLNLNETNTDVSISAAIDTNIESILNIQDHFILPKAIDCLRDPASHQYIRASSPSEVLNELRFKSVPFIGLMGLYHNTRQLNYIVLSTDISSMDQSLINSRLNAVFSGANPSTLEMTDNSIIGMLNIQLISSVELLSIYQYFLDEQIEKHEDYILF